MINGKQIKYFLTLFGVYCVVIFVLAIRHNPKLEVIDLQNWPAATIMPLTKAIRFPSSQARALPSEAVFEFQGNQQRQGWIASDKIPSQLKQAWEVHPLNIGLDGSAQSVPAVDESGIYVGSDSGWFFKFDHQGNKIWSYFASTSMRGFQSTAVLDQNYVYVGATNGMMYCFSKTDGELIWTHQVGSSIESSAILAKGFLYLGVETEGNGFLVKLSAQNGDLLWRTPFTGAHLRSSPVMDESGKILMIANASGLILGIDENSGKTLWKYSLTEMKKADLAVWKDMLLVSSFEKSLYAVKISDGQLIWKKEFKEQLGGISIDPKNGKGYLSSTEGLQAISLATGSELWALRLQKNKNLVNPLLVIGPNEKNMILMACGDELLCGIDAGNGRKTLQIKTNGILSSMPSLFKNKIYVSLQEKAGLQSFSF